MAPALTPPGIKKTIKQNVVLSHNTYILKKQKAGVLQYSVQNQLLAICYMLPFYSSVATEEYGIPVWNKR